MAEARIQPPKAELEEVLEERLCLTEAALAETQMQAVLLVQAQVEEQEALRKALDLLAEEAEAEALVLVINYLRLTFILTNMPIIFDKIQQDAEVKKVNRFITNVNSIQTQEDMKEFLVYLVKYLEEVEARIKKLEIK